MNFILKNKATGEKLHTGTKQECMHFIKCRKYNRHDIVLEPLDNEPTYHNTSMVTEEEPPKKPFFKRLFSK